MKKDFFYNESIKIINNSYKRLEKIRSLPNGNVFKKKINNTYKFYYCTNNNFFNIDNYYNNDNEISMISKEKFNILKNKIKKREKLIKINKMAKDTLRKNIKILNVLDKNLRNSVIDEFTAYNMDMIPIENRNKITGIKSIYYDYIFFYDLNDKKFKNIFNDWIKGKIKAKEFLEYTKKKIFN